MLAEVLGDNLFYPPFAERVFSKDHKRSNGLGHPADIGYPYCVYSDYQRATMKESGVVPSSTRPAAVVDQERYLHGQPSQGTLQIPSLILNPSHIAASAGFIPTLSYPHATPFLIPPSTMHHPPFSVLPQAPSNPYMAIAPYPYLPQTSYPPNPATLTSIGEEPYIQQPWQTQPSQMPLSSAYDQATTASAITATQPQKTQAEALRIGKTKLPINVEDHKREHERRQKKDWHRRKEKRWQRVAQPLIQRICFQQPDWWSGTENDWYPFILSRGRVDPTGHVDCATHDDPEKIILHYATRLSKKTDKITEGELFLLLCLCLVVKESVDEEKINSAISMCVPSLTMKTVKDYLNAVFWVCRLMGNLSPFGWDSKGVTLLVAWDHSVADWVKLRQGADKVMNNIINDLKKPEYKSRHVPHPDLLRESLPSTVQKQLGNTYSYEKVCNLLAFPDHEKETLGGTPVGVAPSPNKIES